MTNAELIELLSKYRQDAEVVLDYQDEYPTSIHANDANVTITEGWCASYGGHPAYFLTDEELEEWMTKYGASRPWAKSFRDHGWARAIRITMRKED